MPSLKEIRPGLHRWTAIHPDWERSEGGAEGWDQEVASLAYEGDGALVLIDPLVPSDDGWRALDELVASHGGPVAIVITCHWHARSGGEALRRYVNSPGVPGVPGVPGATTHTHAEGAGRMGFQITDPFQGDAELPGGVRAFESDRGHGEAVLWLERARALVAGDVLLGAEGERSDPLRTCPEDWLDETSIEDVRNALRPLLELPIEAIVPLHGAPVLDGAQEALVRAVGDSGIRFP